MSRRNKNIVVFSALFLAAAIFLSLFVDTLNIVEVVPKTTEDIDDWTIDDSMLNGQPLNENKNIYLSCDPSRVDNIYITVFPTDTGDEVIDFSAFDLHKANVKDYNPTLHSNITFGETDGSLSPLRNTSIINATIRVRGASTRGARYKSYKISITDKDLYYEGQKTLNLNKHYYDISKVAQKFSFDIMKNIENMASLRTNFFKVYIKDASLPGDEQQFVYQGLYTHVEQPNKTFLEAHGLDRNGTLYKAADFEFKMYEQIRNIDDPLYDPDRFEEKLVIREAENHEKLIEMLTELNDLSKDFSKVFHKYFNEENYLTWLACNILLGNEDTISRNFLIYSPSNSQTWYFLPWDYDGAFAFDEFKNTFNNPDSLKGIQRMTGVQLHRRYFSQEGNIEKLTRKMRELQNTYLTKEKVNELLDLYRPVLNQTMSVAPDLGLLRMSPNALNDYLNRFHNYITTNFNDYIAAIEHPVPVFTSTPRKTEDGTFLFAWEPSKDFQGDLVRYSIRFARDPYMKNIIFEQKDLTVTEFEYEGNLSGTYFMEIQCIDQNGNTQYSYDTYYDPLISTTLFGIRKVVLE